MKKIILLLSTCAIIFALAACQNSDSNSTSSEEPMNSEEVASDLENGKDFENDGKQKSDEDSDKSENSATVKKVNSDEAKALIKDESAILVDVRTQAEYDEKHIEGSVLIPLDQLESMVADIIPEKDTKIILYCRSGNRSHTAGEQLLKMGYTNIYDLGAMSSWEE